jgi:hypothetical protein
MPTPERSHALDHVVLVLFENRSPIEMASTAVSGRVADCWAFARRSTREHRRQQADCAQSAPPTRRLASHIGCPHGFRTHGGLYEHLGDGA